jgi:hypothetical protein
LFVLEIWFYLFSQRVDFWLFLPAPIHYPRRLVAGLQLNPLLEPENGGPGSAPPFLKRTFLHPASNALVKEELHIDSAIVSPP